MKSNMSSSHSLQEEVQDVMASGANCTKHSRRKFDPFFLISPKGAINRTLPRTFNEAIFTLRPKEDNNIPKTENYRPISLNSLDANLLNKFLAY